MEEIDQYLTNRHSNPIHLPNSVLALVFAISSLLVFCCCFRLLSPILATVALVLALNDIKRFKESPGYYTYSSYQNARAAKIISLISLVLIFLGVLSFVGMLVFSNTGQFNSIWENFI